MSALLENSIKSTTYETQVKFSILGHHKDASFFLMKFGIDLFSCKDMSPIFKEA